jgi:hypothetical protein
VSSRPTTTPTTAPPDRSRTRRIIILLALLVLVAALGFQLYRASRPPKGGDPHTDNPQLTAVKTYDYVGGQHTRDPVTYSETPPAGGPHDPTWDKCGVAYDAPPRDENVVHDLEHGTVWITYRPGLDAADVQSLQTQLQGLKSGKWMLSPYPGLPAPVVVTVWNAQLDLTGADDPRLPVFLKVYGDQHTAPEPLSTCGGGASIMASPDNP